jgi:hypothetical protein
MVDDFEWSEPEQEPELGELLVSRTEDGAIQLKGKLDARTGAIVERAINVMAEHLPRAQGTTDDQHRYDAFMEVLASSAAQRSSSLMSRRRRRLPS